MPWYVLFIKSRNEKKEAQKLRERNIEVYYPLVKKKRQWSDRIRIIEELLFSSYCFINLEKHQRDQVFGITGIVR
ncbi:UpxY family transcription antiterminator [Spirosoma pollinicola]|uniref:NusG-like N-terminal domain-containing protein n=1 Tax=Spirosoma pollinicola TaxID=2057025 RepID=A0A2K8ZAJ3_9BACT|nr:hypothetical protein CWM47_36655 [Spirosoma pollinicola]